MDIMNKKYEKAKPAHNKRYVQVWLNLVGNI
jgi:hypothetical protein